ncbi:MAG: Zn-dependent hydrolase [Gammaproteobacteria bacterium]|nr:Zn-dependent hydrolase [Gammaproteobacteria bacterium]MCY4313738.1 Zn-dependent hydrolase [Gammaproteobacteria bacterium]
MIQSIKHLRVNGDRLWNSIMAIAEIGPGQHGGSSRLALTEQDRQARDLFVEWCQAESCSISVDDMGNIFARRSGTDIAKLPICAGSHLDTQPHGGRFDGIYGVLAALEVVRTLNENAIKTRAPIEIVDWTNEEGSRFAPAMIASGVYSGLFSKQYAWSQQDSAGISLHDALKGIGYLGQEPCGERQLGALFEAHIEQGPILEKAEDQIGIVTGGQGVKWFDVTVSGQDSHSGTTPMSNRKDALLAASEIVGMLNRLALDHSPHALATVGCLDVSPGSRNTIPGSVCFSVDLRHPEDDELDKLEQAMRKSLDNVSRKHDMDIHLDPIWHNPPVRFDPECIDAVCQATEQLGLKAQKMISGAGHDACQVCRVLPTAMIFVPCLDGLSHNEAEYATPEDLEAGCNVLLHAMLKVAGVDA